MSARRRQAVLIPAVIAVLLAAAAPAWAAGRLRAAGRRARCQVNAWRRRIPGLPRDGEPLDEEDLLAFLRIAFGWDKTAREERSGT